MERKMYMISDAAKQIEVESHVLRYWEDELELPIKRNKLGHRYYTSEDVNRLKRVKAMKEQGFQLKAIKNALKREIEGESGIIQKPEAELLVPHALKQEIKQTNSDDKEDKIYRLQILLKNMMVEAVKEGSEQLGEQIRESILKELDYQFRMQEEREEEREAERIQREEEHYKKIDEMLREKMGKRSIKAMRWTEKAEKKEKRKKHSIF